jgi:type IV pilus assembly protein PilA
MRERLGTDEGFTLIELMVVVLIIAILIAIAIPSFLGFRKNAQDRSAQSDLRNALLAEQGHYTENEVYTVTAADLKAIEASIVMHATDSKLGIVAKMTGTPSTSVCLERTSASGNVFSVFAGVQAGVGYAKAASPATCPADGAALPAAYTPNGW